MRTIIHLLLSALAVFITARLLPGVTSGGFANAIMVAVVLGIINVTLKPILFILTLPITILTLGLFTLVINGALIELVAKLVPGFYVASFWWALAFAFVLSVVNSFLHSLESR